MTNYIRIVPPQERKARRRLWDRPWLLLLDTPPALAQLGGKTEAPPPPQVKQHRLICIDSASVPFLPQLATELPARTNGDDESDGRNWVTVAYRIWRIRTKAGGLLTYIGHGDDSWSGTRGAIREVNGAVAARRRRRIIFSGRALSDTNEPFFYSEKLPPKEIRIRRRKIVHFDNWKNPLREDFFKILFGATRGYIAEECAFPDTFLKYHRYNHLFILCILNTTNIYSPAVNKLNIGHS